jgi:hypothetical protein
MVFPNGAATGFCSYTRITQLWQARKLIGILEIMLKKTMIFEGSCTTIAGTISDWINQEKNGRFGSGTPSAFEFPRILLFRSI